MFDFAGILGLVVIVLDIWAIITILQSIDKAEIKALWIVLILVLPIIGLLLWFFLKRRESL